MSELISGKEELIALGSGQEVEFIDGRQVWENLKENKNMDLSMFLDTPDWCKFRLKPRTITINDSDVPRCYSIGINRVKGKIEIDFKNTDDADVAYKVLRCAFGF